jgi:hypothetical protein
VASTYSALKFELIGTGEQSGTWGVTTNTNLGTAIEEAIVGYATANFTSDADLTLTLTDTNASQTARNLVLNVTSGVSLSTTRNLIVPTIEKPYYIFNNTTGGRSIVVKTAAGTGVTVPNGSKVLVYGDGINVVTGITFLPSLTVDGTYPVGFLDVPPVGTKTGAYVLATGDVGKYVQVGSGGSIEIPNSTFAEGDIVSIFNNTSGSITITCTITTAYIAGTDTDKATVSLATRGLATILFISGTVCVISGNVS